MASDPKPPYLSGVTKRERALAMTAGVEAALIMYGALAAFLTPSGSHEHDVVLAIALLVIAAPLAWYSASAAFSVNHQSDPLTLRLIIPNGALLALCLNGSLESGPRPYGLMPALVAGFALVTIAEAIWQARTRLSADTRPARS